MSIPEAFNDSKEDLKVLYPRPQRAGFYDQKDNLNYPWNWEQLAVKEEDYHIRYSNSFDEAVVQMSILIKNFNKELCIWHKCTGEQKLHGIYWKKIQENQEMKETAT